MNALRSQFPSINRITCGALIENNFRCQKMISTSCTRSLPSFSFFPSKFFCSSVFSKALPRSYSSYGFCRSSATRHFNSSLGKTASSSYSSIGGSLLSFVRYRIGRLYYSFFYAQYNSKYLLVILVPAFFFAVRFRTDTTLGYRIYVPGKPDENLGSSSRYEHFLDDLAESKPAFSKKDSKADSFVGTDSISALRNWKNGTKVFMDDGATVSDLKQKFIKTGNKALPDGILAACHGRILEDSDLLAFAVRAYCKRDPKIFIWRE
ncbi:hypothetical protein IE077_004357 [Cardiosporidium cionae]|uniref:Ubiquitin-like domain-containing protein n=1 Tax=Cardiosporidium cionae TaxID=476202 RepID=A0ABQ7JCF3_9APIC|nr:hypothetical protein IE077_004357 [Cardiosporidium cionae]|eukprot:KAF8821320.1 hypothetical protein IE077_004357 [Cardiosporidium cionae]